MARSLAMADDAAEAAVFHRLAELAPASTLEERQGAVRRWTRGPGAEITQPPTSEARDGALLRVLAQQVAGRAERQTLRETLASQQVALVLRTRGEPEERAAALVSAIARESGVAHRQLLDGQIDTERLELLVERLGRAPRETTPAVPLPVAATVLTAADILEQCRRRADGGEGAAEAWQAVLLEGRIEGGADTPASEAQLFLLRPNRWRVHLREAGRTTRIVAWDGEQGWQQRGGEAPSRLAADELARWARLAACDATAVAAARASVAAERLPDGVSEGRATYRLALGAAGPAQVIVEIDQERFTEVLATRPDGALAQGDFREVAGSLLPHRREWRAVDAEPVRLAIMRAQADPGLLPTFFHPPQAGELDLFTFEAQLPRTVSLP